MGAVDVINKQPQKKKIDYRFLNFYWNLYTYSTVRPSRLVLFGLTLLSGSPLVVPYNELRATRLQSHRFNRAGSTTDGHPWILIMFACVAGIAVLTMSACFLWVSR